MGPRARRPRSSTGSTEAALLERAAICHFYADDMPRSVTLLARALALVDEAEAPRRAAWLHGLLYRSLWGLLRQEEATKMLDRGLALLEDDGPSPERAGLLARRAKSLMVQSRYHQAVRAARRGARPSRRGWRSRAARYVDEIGALNALGVSLMATGGDRGGRGSAAPRARHGAARRTARSTSPRRRSTSATPCTTSAGRTEALEVARKARAQLADLPIREVWLSLLIAQQAFDAGDWDTVEAMLAAVAGRRPKGGTPELDHRLRRAELELARDEREAAREHLARAAELAVDSREPQYLGVLGALQAELAMREGDVEAGRAAVDESLDRIEFCSDDALRMAMVSAAGLEARGRRRAARARPRRRGRGRRPRSPTPSCSSPGCARARRTAGRSSRPSSTTRRPTTAAPPVTTTRRATPPRRSGVGGARPPVPRGARAVAPGRGARGRRRPRGGGRPGRAPRWRSRERLGATWLAGELESLVARGRLRAARRGRRRRGGRTDDEPFGLTPRERQVLALVAAGATNREIGKQLYMAEKTASVHVSRILAKLDVRSRTEAAGVAHRLGLDAVA